MPRSRPNVSTQLRMGMKVELEHGKVHADTDVTGDDPVKTQKIALAHVREIPDYYTRLAKMEKRGKKRWEKRKISEGTDAVMALRQRQKVPPGTPYNTSKAPPISAVVTGMESRKSGKKLLKTEDREDLISALMEYAMVWGAPPPMSPDKQIDRIRKLLS